MSIDLSQLPAPEIIETIDYETIFANRLAEFQLKNPDYTALVESDPVYKLIEENAYREVMLRQRINNAVKAVLLAYAKGANLENLAAFWDVERLMIDPGDPNAVPPIDPTYESDEALLARVLLAPGKLSTAGSEGSYKYWARSASGKVIDVSVQRPTPGDILISVLSSDGNGAADQALLDLVEAALSAEDVRPLNDTVIVQSAEIVEYTIDATIYLYPNTTQDIIKQQVESSLAAKVAALHKVGYSVPKSAIDSAATVEGVQRVDLGAFADIAITNSQASYCTAITVTIGGTSV